MCVPSQSNIYMRKISATYSKEDYSLMKVMENTLCVLSQPYKFIVSLNGVPFPSPFLSTHYSALFLPYRETFPHYTHYHHCFYHHSDYHHLTRHSVLFVAAPAMSSVAVPSTVPKAPQSASP